MYAPIVVMQRQNEHMAFHLTPNLSGHYVCITCSFGNSWLEVIFAMNQTNHHEKNPQSWPDPHFPDRLSGMGGRQQRVFVPNRIRSDFRGAQRPEQLQTSIRPAAYAGAGFGVDHAVSKNARQNAHLHRTGLHEPADVVHSSGRRTGFKPSRDTLHLAVYHQCCFGSARSLEAGLK